MANWGDYSSLLQLGFGIGLGLSVFRAPLELMSKSFREDLESEVAVLNHGQTAHSKQTLGKLNDLQLSFAQTSQTLNSFHLPFMIAAILGALVNWAFLCYAAGNASVAIDYAPCEWFLLLVSGPYFALIALILALVTQWQLRPLQVQLDQIRGQ